ncbi:MAG: sulfate ABC transporter permease subunit CysW [Polyangiaceae bacterium]|nr:sulfate ABC transporter permease subunit CysW [Polyangiaceae bacterium]MCW5788918.1 sulfate ABC transporter permease subunit CysW [Polyangiaceae bacterium]
MSHAQAPKGALAKLLIGASLAFVALFLVLPLALVFVSAFAEGAGAYFEALADEETWSAVKLTLLTAAISVPLNVVFGVCAAWLLSKYDFWGKSALLTVIDLPFSVSPVIAGLVFVLLFGSGGWFYSALSAADVKIIFAVPGVIIATTFVTFPMVAREVLGVMEAQGSDEEEAALTLGASGWQLFTRVTLPKIRWGVAYGVILSNARAMGEFGAVSVVSGHIRGETNTMPLHIEILYGEYNFVGAFAVASLLTLLAVVTLVLKQWVEWRTARAARGFEGAPAEDSLEGQRALLGGAP